MVFDYNNILIIYARTINKINSKYMNKFNFGVGTPTKGIIDSSFVPIKYNNNYKINNKGTIINKTYTDKDGFNTKFTIERTANVNVFNNKDNINKTGTLSLVPVGLLKLLLNGAMDYI